LLGDARHARLHAAFPKMRRGWPGEWVRGWNRTPA
jgi:hypothetical protein